MSIGIVGLGYVGLPLAVAFAEAGEHVVGVDLDSRKVTGIRAGHSYIEDIPDARLRGVDGRIHATSRFVELHECEAILICVPTPLTRNREPDLGALLGAGRALAGVIRRGQLIVLESTTFPGTTREHLVPLLEESGLRAGEDFVARVLARARRPGAHRLHDSHDPEGRGRPDRGLHGARRGRLRARVRPRRARLHPGGRRALQAAGEHLPLRQHRARQRARDGRRPDGHRHLGGRSTRPRRSRSASCASSRARAWAATACPSTRST